MDQEKKAGCLFGWLEKLIQGPQAPSKEQAQPPSVMISKKFITNAEFSFMRVLQQAVGNNAYILAQVSMNQLFYCKAASDRKIWQNRIRAKAIDFVLCDPKTMRPMLAIELDDSSHQEDSRRDRDKMIDIIFQAANLHILHIPAARQYDIRALKSQIENTLKTDV